MDIVLVDLALRVKLRKITAAADQHQLIELSTDRVLEACHLLTGTDAGTNHRDFSGLVIESRCALFSSAKHQTWLLRFIFL